MGSASIFRSLSNGNGLCTLALCLMIWISCSPGSPGAASPRSFDEIRVALAGQDATAVLTLLGPPDSRQKMLDEDERWVWWGYTYLDGDDYAPELRGQVVHLEITFRNIHRTGGELKPLTDWIVDETFGITYLTPEPRR